ncbi:hypothetical protein B0H14DRAFT_2564867 [Mycena olivaceomarginata]|nr:hypothetical protein B0H14DRAFT_2564867 [Mycena olivaceomarginata]
MARLPSLASLVPLQSFSSQTESHLAGLAPLRIPADPVTIPDEFSCYSDFKYRLWYIWYIWHRTTPRGPPWLTVLCGANVGHGYNRGFNPYPYRNRTRRGSGTNPCG